MHDYRYHAEPSGTFYRYDAKAIGSGSEGAQAELQNEYHKVGRRIKPLPKPCYPLKCRTGGTTSGLSLAPPSTPSPPH